MVSTENYINSGKTLRVLLAEDEDIYQQIIQNYVEALGLKLTIVENGKKCIAEAGDQSYDIILMDIEMPEKDGLQTTLELREKGIRTPIIAVTSNTWKEDEITSKESGMNDFLAKPFNKSKLEKTIKYWASKSPAST